MFAPYAGRPEGDDLRLGPHHRRRSALRPGDEDRRDASPSGGGWSSPGPGPGSCRRRWRAPGASTASACRSACPFEQGANPVIAGDEKYVTHEVLLHPQADAGEGEPGVRLPARRVRHARRDVRAAHADPDRQGPAGADRVPRHARRPVLGGDRHDDPRPARAPRARRRGDTKLYLVTSSSTRRRREIDRFYRNYDSIRYVGDFARRSASARRRRTSSWPSSTTGSATSCARGRIERSEPMAIERRHDDHVELPRIRFAFTAPPQRRPAGPDRHAQHLRPSIESPDGRPAQPDGQRSAFVDEPRSRRAAFSATRRAWVSVRSASGRRPTPSATACGAGRRTARRAPRRRRRGARRAPSIPGSRSSSMRFGDDVDRVAHRRGRRGQRRGQVHRAARVGAGDDRRARTRPRRARDRRRPCGRGSRRPARAAAPSRRRRRRSTARRRRARRRRRRARARPAPAGGPAARGAGGTDPARSPAGAGGPRRREPVEARSASHSWTSSTRAEKAAASGVPSRWP